jgi:hypothetical protein
LIEKNLLFYYNFVGVENIAGLNQLYFIWRKIINMAQVQ